MNARMERLIAVLLIASHLAFAGWAGDRRAGGVQVVRSSVGIVDVMTAMGARR